MVKKVLFAFAVATMLASCNVNDDFDLSNVDTDNIEIGNEETTISLPVANFKINVNDTNAPVYSYTDGVPTVVISRTPSGSSIGDDINDIMETANAWMPSNSTVDIAKLASTDEKVSVAESDRIVDLFVAELKTNEAKRLKLAEEISDNSNDFGDVYEILGVNTNMSADVISATILETITSGDFDISSLKYRFHNEVAKNIKSQASHQIYQSIDALDISAVEDLFADLNNKIKIVTSYTDDGTLPFKFEVTSLRIVAGSDTISLNEEIPMKDLIEKLNSNNLTIEANINITEYNSTVAAQGARYLKIILGVEVSGSIKL